MDIKGALKKIAGRQDLTGEEMRSVMNVIMSGEATPSQIGAFLIGMRVKGETVGEIAAAVSILREKMVPVEASEDVVDIVGTGGDGAETLNISTTTAIVVAAAGVPVAKHGNRALSSKSGAADVLQALGVKIDLTPAQISRCIREAGIGFMFAPAHHPAMKHVGPSRSEIGTRTMFNLLGPQANPAGARRYMLGVFDKSWVEPVAAALLANRAISAWVVHGDGGLDEISTTGPSFVASIKGGNLTSFEITPGGRRHSRVPAWPTSRAASRRTTPAVCAHCSTARRTPIAISCCSMPRRRSSSRAAPTRSSSASGSRRKRSTAAAPGRPSTGSSP